MGEVTILHTENGKVLVAVESTEDYSDIKAGFYTDHSQEGREGIRYRLVTVSEEGLLVPVLGEKQFFLNEKFCKDYIAAHGELEIVSYDRIIDVAAKQQFKNDSAKKEKQEEKSMEHTEHKERSLKFVTIELSRKQVDLEHTRISEKNGKEYARIFAPGHGVLFYPADSIKESDKNANQLYFSRPEGTELQIYYSIRKEGVPDSAPNNEKYERYTRTVKIEDLKAAYDSERQAFIDRKNQEREAKNATFVNMSVPTEWGKIFHGNNGRDYVSIAVPVPEGENEYNYYSFIIPAERFRKSDLYPGSSYFGFPRNKRDGGEEYTVTLKRSEKQEDGTYTDVEKQISSAELKEYVDAAVKRAAEKEQNARKQNEEKETMKEESNKEDDPFMSVPPDEELPFMEPDKKDNQQQQSRPAGRHGR